MLFTWLTERKTRIVRTLLSNRMKFLMALVALFCAAGARADIIDITIMNATYTAPCVGGGTCTEVINGSFSGNVVTLTLNSVSLSLTGTLNATLDGFGTPPVCSQGGCTEPPLFYDLNAHSGQSPIEWNPTINIIPALTPTAFGSGSSLFIPTGCGGDVTSCGAAGTFSPSSTRDNQLVSGTYTAIDETVNLQGGSPSNPVILVGTTPVAQVAGTISGGQEDYYSFYWGGGAFSASTTLTGATTSSFVFSAGTVGTCSSLGSTTLNSGNMFTGSVSGSLAAGTYCIGLDDVSGGDPNFAITFATPLTTPEPSGFVLLSAGLGLIALLHFARRRHDRQYLKTYLIAACALLPLGIARGSVLAADPSLFATTGSMSTCALSDTELPASTTATVSETGCSMGPSAGTAAFTGSATATYSAVHAYASMTLTGATFASAQDYSSYARLIDNLDIVSGGNNAADISIGIAIDGTWSETGLGFVRPVLTFGFNYPSTTTPFTQTSLPVSNGSVNTVFWTPFYPIADFENDDYFVSLSLQIDTLTGANQTAAGTLNFSNTAALQYVDVTDSNGNFIPNVVVTTAGSQDTGQTNFVLGDVNAPEPSSFGLVCAAILILAAWKRLT